MTEEKPIIVWYRLKRTGPGDYELWQMETQGRRILRTKMLQESRFEIIFYRWRNLTAEGKWV